MGIVNSGTKALCSFLKDNCYYVLEYQRSYAWEHNLLQDLWIDLLNTYEVQETKTHFFGQIVIHNEDTAQKKYIIDGQQRITTSVILLDAFRSIYQGMYKEGKRDDKFEIEDITTMYIGRSSDKRFEPRLFLNDDDRIFFAERIQKESKLTVSSASLSKLKKSETLIHEASIYFETKLKEFLKSFQDLDTQYNEFKRLLSVFLNEFIFMTIETNDVNEAFVIFETLNARGKELEIADLLKNHVFRTSWDSIADAKIAWSQMLANLDGINPTRFIRHYWNAQHRFVREKDLYLAIRQEINSPSKVAELMLDLVSLSELYLSLHRPYQMTYFNDAKLIEQNKGVDNLKATAYYPIIMALVVKDFSESEISDIHTAIECLIVRNFTVSGKSANRSEKNFAGIAQKIAQNELTTASAIIESINVLIISDEEFYDNFKVFEVKRSGVIRYLLRKIHNHINVETCIISDNDTVHIEHIMSKKIGNADEWDIDPEQHEKYLNRFGNLTLLGQEYNRSAVNKNFTSKKDIYRKSEIPMARELTKYDNWSIEAIEDRQKKLADIAILIWNKI